MAVLVNPYQFAVSGPVGDSYLTPWFTTNEGGGGTRPGTASGFGTGSFALTIPPKSMVGDILVLFVETANGEAATVSAGWTEAPDSPTDAADCRLTVFWRRKEAGDTSVTVNDSGSHQVAVLLPIRGCIETGNPWHVTNSNTGAITVENDPLIVNGFTTTENNCLVLIAGATRENFGWPEGFTNADLTNLAGNSWAGEIGGTSQGAIGVSAGEKVTAGEVGDTEIGFTEISGYVGWVGALLPAATPTLTVANIGSPLGSTNATFVPLPEHKENDILVAFVETANQAVTVDGFTEAGSSPASNTNTRLTVFWKRAGASESNPTLSDSGDHQNGVCIAIRNAVLTGDPFDVTNSAPGGTGTSISIVGATTTENGCLVLAAAGTAVDAAATDTTFSGWTNADLTGLLEIMDRTSSSGNGGGFGVVAGYKATAGAYGTTAVTQTSSVEYSTWTGAIKPE